MAGGWIVSHAYFSKSSSPPSDIPQHIKAAYEVGVLTVILPKVEKAKPREIKLEVFLEKKLKA
jgi:HSP20 family molecular chaperone IbpA